MIFILREKYGFTAIEIILVLILISFISIVVMEKRNDFNAEAVGGRAVIKNHIRYAQLMAMKSNTVCGIVFNQDAYWIFRNDSTLNRITLPGNDGTDFSIPSRLGTAAETICFDLWGSPCTSNDFVVPRPTGPIGTLGITMTTDTGYVQ